MIKKFSLVFMGALAVGSLASATVLTPGMTGAPSGFSNAGFTLLATTGTQALTSPTFTATANAWVYSDTNNTFCSGCLDFVYQVTRVGGSDPIERITGGSFTGYLTNIGFVTGSPGTMPTTVDVSSNGSVVGFNFTGASALSGTSGTQTLVIQTNTKNYTAGLMSAIDSQSANGVAFQPASVPEPVSISLLGGGLALLGMLRFRRKA